MFILFSDHRNHCSQAHTFHHFSVFAMLTTFVVPQTNMRSEKESIDEMFIEIYQDVLFAFCCLKPLKILETN